MKLCIFDVCGTLTSLNSTYDYINYLIKRGVKPYYKHLLGKKYLSLFLFIISKIAGYNIERSLAFRFFKGLKKEKLDILNKDFFDYYKNNLINENKIKICLNNKNCKTILLSGSINIPIDFLSKHYEIESFSSELCLDNGIYTGKAKRDLMGNKQKIFIDNNLKIDDFNEIILYTDNLTDAGLIEYIQQHNKKLKLYAIAYGNKEKWGKLISSLNIKDFYYV